MNQPDVQSYLVEKTGGRETIVMLVVPREPIPPCASQFDLLVRAKFLIESFPPRAGWPSEN